MMNITSQRKLSHLLIFRMTVFDEAVQGYAELSKEFKGKSPNLEKCGKGW